MILGDDFRGDMQPDLPAKPQPVDPVLDNGRWGWIEDLAKIGFTPLAIAISYSAPLWSQSGFERVLDKELRAAKLGHFDSAKFGSNPIIIFVYLRTQTLANGLQFCKQWLCEAGLLPVCRMNHADLETRTWRIFYPLPEGALT